MPCGIGVTKGGTVVTSTLTGHQRDIRISEATISRIMTEWNSEIERLRRKYNVDLLRDTKPPQIREIEDILYVICQSFPLDDKNSTEFTCALCVRLNYEWAKARKIVKSELGFNGSRRYLSHDLDVLESKNRSNGDDRFSSLEEWSRLKGSHNVSFSLELEDAIEARIRELVPLEFLEHMVSTACDDSMLWNYPRFASEILRTARIRNTSTKEVIQCSLNHITALCSGDLRKLIFEGLFGPYEKLLVRDCLTITRPRGRARSKS